MITAYSTEMDKINGLNHETQGCGGERHLSRNERRASQLREAQRRYRKNHPDRVKAERKRYRLAHPRPYRPQDAKKWFNRVKYGISLELRNEIMNANGGMCYICHERVSECIDHDHQTGKVRGALCGACNTGLGCFRDNGHILAAAMKYLEET